MELETAKIEILETMKMDVIMKMDLIMKNGFHKQKHLEIRNSFRNSWI